MRQTPVLLLLAALGTGACSFDLSTNPNNPEAVGDAPSVGQVSATAIGVLLALRPDVADRALDMGILGREAFRFDGSDPRFTGEMLHGPLDAGSTAFGGDHWLEEYNAIRTAQDLLNVISTAPTLTAEEQSATSGYLKTMQALSFQYILNSHTQDSIPITVGTEVTAPPQPFVTNAEAFAHVNQLLDDGLNDLTTAGATAFPFQLPAGFAGFDTPATFIKFNRGLRAREAVYQNQFADALTALAGSFIDPAGAMSLGVYMDYGTNAGDFANTLAVDPQNGENFVHPSIQTGVQLKLDATPDNRFLTKTVARPTGSADNLTSSLGWIRYPSPTSSIPLLKNEELILLREEANIGLGDLASALTDINTVRAVSGGLPPAAPFADATAALDELLYNKTYSLLYEGGNRWIDARHYGRLNTLPVDRPGDVVFSTLPIPNFETLPRQ